MKTENKILFKKNFLICLQELDPYLNQNFCGIVIRDLETLEKSDISDICIIYLCGNVGETFTYLNQVHKNSIYVIEDLSFNYQQIACNLILSGEVPININNVGIFFREFFNDKNKDYFNLISTEHKFQSLTESNKGGSSYRTGIYITPVNLNDGEIKFNLLRCSTNFDGPTENCKNTDDEILTKLNNISKYFFSEEVSINHILAQIYNNIIVNDCDKKAKIKEHSDKTKDMPLDAIMAFCSFYENYSNGCFNKNFKNVSKIGYDYLYKNKTTSLTKLKFKLKNNVNDNDLVKSFNVTLYPNSVFLIPLSTNRLYTHEIIPSILPVESIPKRMGYVARCSKTKAIFKDNQTYIEENGILTKLTIPFEDDIHKLKQKYYEENVSTNLIEYDNIYFSLNSGDYEKPLL